jgi:hypothetical protein
MFSIAIEIYNRLPCVGTCSHQILAQWQKKCQKTTIFKLCSG